jgi:L-2-hydroxyglutarate oxidase LhgO
MASFVVGCGGLHADRLSRLAGIDTDVRIVPFRGEYYRIREDRQHLVRHLIYPVPDPRFPFLGVHFTRRIQGGIEAGPNAVLAFAREGYSLRNINVRDLAESLRYRGLWKFMTNHSRLVASEFRRSFSRTTFAESLSRLVPSITESDLQPSRTGVRAQAIRRDGSLVEDFSFAEADGCIFVLNAPSPAATASLALGDYIAERVQSRFTQ